jgi:radical SAM protein with 4Fe4S-binding SPASM domain
MVSDSLWNLLVDQAAKHRLLLTIVNNGHFVERRIDEKSIELIDTLTISIDGISREVFAENRGGADLKRVLAAVEYFHRLRQRVCLPRRPKLCLSWTLKKNNIAEFPEFVRAMARFNPDRYYVRHLLVCHDKDAEQSLLKLPDLANRYLEEAYAEMEKQGAETDCPPLIGAVRSASTGIVASSSSEPVVNLEDSEVHSLAEAEVTTAAAGEIIATSEGAAHRSLMRDERCNYIHRTASIKAQGSMTTCGIYHARKAGDYEPESGFLSLWNGAVMQAVRRDLNTENEWEQCQNCWYRESRYQSQRDQRAKVQNYSMKNKSFYSEQAWDYRS